MGKLRLDLEGPIRSQWNLKAARRFRKHFQQSGIYPTWPDADIEGTFLRHTETIRSHYQQQTGEISRRGIYERNDKSARRRRVITVSNNSVRFLVFNLPKLQLTNRRRAVCESTEGMAKFKGYIDTLDRGGGMSEDEPDRRTASRKTSNDYLIIRPAWRSEEVTKWLRVMDLVCVATPFTSDGRVTRGKWMRNRIPSNKVDSTAKPVKGLPVNFYDGEWLKSLDPKKKALKILEEKAESTHTEEIVR